MKDISRSKVAIYGGSFNPIHHGHLLTALDVQEKLGIDYIIFVPANIPIHKSNIELIDADHRLKMTELSVSSIKYFIVSDCEIKRGDKSYTIDTVKFLIEKYKLILKPYIIIGDDLLSGLTEWKNIDELINIADIICLRRIVINNKDYKTDINIKFINNRIIDISSTDIRKRIKNDLSIDFMVTEKVKNYILKNKLYKV